MATDPDGPAWTILRADPVPTGGVRFLVRKRGGQLLRIYAQPGIIDGPDLEILISSAVSTWRQRPPEPWRNPNGS